MKVGVLHRRWQVFIDEMIKSPASLEDQIRGYMKAFPTCKKETTARVNSYKLLQRPEILEAITAGRRRIEEERLTAEREERIRLAKLQVAHESELDAQLTRIALGQFKRKVKRPVYNRETQKFEVVAIEEEPSETDMIAAADKLYRRKGSYAPTTLKHEGGDTFLDFMKEVAKNKTTNEVQPGSSKKVD